MVEPDAGVATEPVAVVVLRSSLPLVESDFGLPQAEVIAEPADTAASPAAPPAGVVTRELPEPAGTPVAPLPPAPSEGLRRIRACESGGNYKAVDPSRRYFGAYQFDQGTWDAVVGRAGHPEYIGINPVLVPPEAQDAAAAQLYAERGGAPWPVCQYR